jgi:ribosomal protein S18 acetylase RimI-like enzyme
VLPRYRRRGVGRGLAMRLIEDGFARAPRLHLRATHALSIAFWDALGFARIAHESRTHEMVRP